MAEKQGLWGGSEGGGKGNQKMSARKQSCLSSPGVPVTQKVRKTPKVGLRGEKPGRVTHPIFTSLQ